MYSTFTIVRVLTLHKEHKIFFFNVIHFFLSRMHFKPFLVHHQSLCIVCHHSSSFIVDRIVTVFKNLKFSFTLVTHFCHHPYNSVVYHLLVITLIFLLGSKVYILYFIVSYLSYQIRYLSLGFVLKYTVKTTYIQRVQSAGERAEIYNLYLYSSA